MLSKGADIGFANKRRRTPPHTASLYGYTNVVNLLLRHGSDVAYIIRPEFASLYALAANGHAYVLKLLLASGAEASVDTVNTARYRGYQKIISMLLNYWTLSQRLLVNTDLH